MNLIKLIVSTSYQSFGIVMMLIGLGMVVMAFINSPLQLQIAMWIIGLGFFSLGLVHIKRAQSVKAEEERFNKIIAKLDEIQQELKKEEQPKGTGVAIADVITSGLKYYADQITKSKKEEDNE
jgi:Na+/phosphate symporter